MTPPALPNRIKLPDTRPSVTRKNAVGGQEFYITVGFYEDDVAARGLLLPAEVFIHISKEGSTLAGMCDALAMTISLALQHRVTWEELSRHYKHTRFEPHGPDLRNTQEFTSLIHAIAVTIDEIIRHQHSLWGGQQTTTEGGPESASFGSTPSP